jgi:hypothetical protein
VPVFDELALTGLLLIQALTERHNPLFSIVIPVVVGSSPISHPNSMQAPGAVHRQALFAFWNRP